MTLGDALRQKKKRTILTPTNYNNFGFIHEGAADQV